MHGDPIVAGQVHLHRPEPFQIVMRETQLIWNVAGDLQLKTVRLAMGRGRAEKCRNHDRHYR